MWNPNRLKKKVNLNKHDNIINPCKRGYLNLTKILPTSIDKFDD